MRERERRTDVSYTFFGVQVAIKAFFKDPLRQRLHAAIAESQSSQSLQDKRAFWKRIAAILNEATPVFEYGYWDLIRTDKAEEEFETWTSEVEGALATEQEEMGTAADEVHRLSAEKNYILCTVLFLVERDSNSDLTLGSRCDLPESEYFTRATFAQLIGAIPMFNFANVQADAVYLSPGSEEDGLSEEDLRGEGFNYLKPLA